MCLTGSGMGGPGLSSPDFVFDVSRLELRKKALSY